DLIMAAINDEPFDVAAKAIELTDVAESLCLGPSTACIVDAATERRIPSIRLTAGNLVQLGYGAKQRRVWTAETDQTCAIAESIASDKDLTKSMLSACGVPVPDGRVVASVEDAWEAALDVGLPVVVKPTDANHGRGVSLDLSSREDVEAAFHLAARHGSEVLVECFIAGDEHRLLVVGGRVVAAARGEVARITGDGKTNVFDLVERQINSDPRRGLTEDFPLNKLMIDNDTAIKLELQRQGLTAESVPAEGRQVLIQRNGNVSLDVTDKVHPAVAAAVSLAARIVGLDIAGVDLVAQDISRPLEEQRGAIVEVNAGPGLLMHLRPAEGEPRAVGRPIVDHLFPEDNNGRIPIVGVTGSDDTTRVARLIAWLLYIDGRHAGVACRDGLYFDQRQVERGDCANWHAGQRLLINRTMQAAVFETPAAAILGEGLPYDRCNVGVVTSLRHTEDVARFDILDDEKMAGVLRTQVDVVLDEGVAVLNADDAGVAAMADLSDGEVIFYGLDENADVMTAHFGRNGRAVVLRDGAIVLRTGSQVQRLTARPIAPPSATLAAVAAAWALGLAPDLMSTGIGSFESSFDTNKNAGVMNKRARR
ncbi:MAG: cphA, partial [Rhodocyclales bacterium]|nr:cphA [Rhodocyclales bacterium]